MQRVVDANDDLHSLIKFNDEILTDQSKLKNAVKANEFLLIYFGNVFGVNLPVISKRVEGPNIFNTTNISWDLKITTDDLLLGVPINEKESIHVISQQTPSFPLKALFIKAAYQQFSEKIDLKNLNPDLIHHEERKVLLKNGKILEARVTKNEFAEKRLYNNLLYTLTLEL